jgi:hypothetical protein
LKNLQEVSIIELQGKTFEIIHVVEMLCEVCERQLGKKEKSLRTIQIMTEEDYRNLLERASAHERAEIDVENCKIYFYDHDFPGDIHAECIEKL